MSKIKLISLLFLTVLSQASLQFLTLSSFSFGIFNAIKLSSLALLGVYLFKKVRAKHLLILGLGVASLLNMLGNFFFNSLFVDPNFHVNENIALLLLFGVVSAYLYEYYILERYPTFQKIGYILLPITFALAIKICSTAIPMMIFMIIIISSVNTKIKVISFLASIGMMMILDYIGVPFLFNPTYLLTVIPLSLIFREKTISNGNEIIAFAYASLFPTSLWILALIQTYS